LDDQHGVGERLDWGNCNPVTEKRIRQNAGEYKFASQYLSLLKIPSERELNSGAKTEGRQPIIGQPIKRFSRDEKATLWRRSVRSENGIAERRVADKHDQHNLDHHSAPDQRVAENPVEKIDRVTPRHVKTLTISERRSRRNRRWSLAGKADRAS
jgi:hypothetical protein